MHERASTVAKWVSHQPPRHKLEVHGTSTPGYPMKAEKGEGADKIHRLRHAYVLSLLRKEKEMQYGLEGILRSGNFYIVLFRVPLFPILPHESVCAAFARVLPTQYFRHIEYRHQYAEREAEQRQKLAKG